MISKPKFKICKRLGAGVYDKCQTPKFSFAPKTFGPGSKRPKALSEYGTQLVEKQKIRFAYGVSEKQLSNYVNKALNVKGAGASEKFYEDIESRLDNVVYRMGLASSRRFARQLVSHGHFIVNEHKVTIPSYSVKVGDIIKIREGSKSKNVWLGLAEKIKEYKFPDWVSFDINIMQGSILAKPKNNDTFFDLNAVLEFYSR
ncbi:MAG: 30S ribosomal protein S4 [Candidatus Pacebacteria bacterium]|nr:30S ribosomal protein S4 [Candidatus Paceibacterota bacterium]MCF7862917.1 30S ribosomal protein S4 [Candidatus Paceibacterota bacterium]